MPEHPSPAPDLDGLTWAAGGVGLLCFFPENPDLHCGLSLRAGGVSAPPFDSMNVGGSTADRPEAVEENRRRFYRATGLEPAAAARMHQVHGPRVVQVSAAGSAGEADGLVTAERDLALLVTVADCLPVFLTDGVAGVIGVLHAGWRGIQAGVLEAGVEAALAAGAARERLTITLGPGIGGCCFEVSHEVAEGFARENWRPGRRGRPHVDLAAEARLRLREAGLAREAVRGPLACTRCRSDLFFSARAGEPTGRMVGFIVRRAASQF